MIIDQDFKTFRNVGGLEIVGDSDNPRFAVPLVRSRLLADAAREAAKTELETQRFFNAVDGANRYPSITQIHIF